MEEDISLLRRALSQVLTQDITTSVVDYNLKYVISPQLKAQYEELQNILMKFSTATDFRQESNSLQMCKLKFRYLLMRTQDEFIQTNKNINIISPDQMIFLQNITILGGKLQSYYQLLATAANHAKIYDKLREAAVLSELTGKDAIEYLRRKGETQSGNLTRSDIKEIETTKKSFDELKGINNIVNGIQVMIQNIEMGLVNTFVFYIFYGIPGTGKTALAESIATRFSNGEYYKFDQSFFSSTYLGVTESRIRNILDTVRSNPKKNYTIIIDEADNIFGNVLMGQHLNSVKILLQTEISSYGGFGPNLIIIAITNYLTRIDQTFRRRATSVIQVPPPLIPDCLSFLKSQLTFNDCTWTEEYERALLQSFSNSLVYTNSDMGRLAKNVNDTFLSEIDSLYNMKIRLYESQKIIIFTESFQSLIVKKISSDPIEFNGTYFEARQLLAERLLSTDSNLLGYRKCFAPKVSVMQRAILAASSLTKTMSKSYLEQ